MRIAVTGSSKLAGAIVKQFGADSYRVDYTIDKDKYDVFINNAHVGFQQCFLLEEFAMAWWDDPTKLIINISSRAGLPNLSKGYMYAAQKAALDHLADNLTYNSDKKCRITTINLGMLEDELPSLSYKDVCKTIEDVLQLSQHVEMPRIILQHSHNYQDIQQLKKARY